MGSDAGPELPREALSEASLVWSCPFLPIAGAVQLKEMGEGLRRSRFRGLAGRIPLPRSAQAAFRAVGAVHTGVSDTGCGAGATCPCGLSSGDGVALR